MLINIRRALVAIVSVYKGNLPSFQCKMNLDRSASMGEVDGLSLILIDLYVPALTSRVH
jgi:hypothetical protein